VEQSSWSRLLHDVGTLRHMSHEHATCPAVGPVDGQWLDQVSPWLEVGDSSAITLLPRRITNGKAIYRDDVGPLMKWLRSEGFDARFLDTPDQTFESHYGAISDILLAVLVNMGSNAAWDGFKFLLHKIRHRARDMKSAGIEPQCKISLGLVKYPDGSSLMWQDISGPAEEVLDFAESIARDYIAGNLSGANAEIESDTGQDHPSQDVPE
jgi:hypothetical protein